MSIFSCKACLSIVVVLFMMIFISGCKANKIIMKPEKEEVDVANQEGNAVDYDEAVKRHFAMQSENAKRMMLKSDKNRKGYNSGISRSWYDNLFNNSCFRNSCMVKTGHGYISITKSRSCFIKE